MQSSVTGRQRLETNAYCKHRRQSFQRGGPLLEPSIWLPVANWRSAHSDRQLEYWWKNNGGYVSASDPKFLSTPISNLYFHTFHSLLLDSEGAEQDGRWLRLISPRPLFKVKSIFFPRLHRIQMWQFTAVPTASEKGICTVPPPLAPLPMPNPPNPPTQLAAELEMNGPPVRKNKLMNTEVAFYFSLPPSFLFTVIKEMKSTWEWGLFGSFSREPAPATEWNMTHQFNYCLGIVSPRYKYWFSLLPPRISLHYCFCLLFLSRCCCCCCWRHTLKPALLPPP